MEPTVASVDTRKAKAGGGRASRDVVEDETSSVDPAPARERIMREAEKLFAEHGPSSVSGRSIISEAKVNVAALHYYFGTKERLLQEIFEERARPIVEARERNLVECRESPDRPPMLEQVLEAFLRPCFVQSPDIETDVRLFSRLRARLATEPEEVSRDILGKTFDASSLKYLRALGAALPELPEDELHWRFHFLLGTMVYSMANAGRIQALTQGHCDPSDGAEALRRLVPFLAAAFRAPPSG